MNPIRFAKALVSESVRAICEVVIPPLVGRLITGFAEGGDTRLWVEPDPPRNPGARSAPQSAQEGQQ